MHSNDTLYKYTFTVTTIRAALPHGSCEKPRSALSHLAFPYLCALSVLPALCVEIFHQSPISDEPSCPIMFPRKPIRIRTSKTCWKCSSQKTSRKAKSFRIRTSKKRGGPTRRSTFYLRLRPQRYQFGGWHPLPPPFQVRRRAFVRLIQYLVASLHPCQLSSRRRSVGAPRETLSIPSLFILLLDTFPSTEGRGVHLHPRSLPLSGGVFGPASAVTHLRLSRQPACPGPIREIRAGRWAFFPLHGSPYTDHGPRSWPENLICLSHILQSEGFSYPARHGCIMTGRIRS